MRCITKSWQDMTGNPALRFLPSLEPCRCWHYQSQNGQSLFESPPVPLNSAGTQALPPRRSVTKLRNTTSESTSTVGLLFSFSCVSFIHYASLNPIHPFTRSTIPTYLDRFSGFERAHWTSSYHLASAPEGKTEGQNSRRGGGSNRWEWVESVISIMWCFAPLFLSPCDREDGLAFHLPESASTINQSFLHYCPPIIRSKQLY